MGGKMVSAGLDNISRFQGDDSTVGVSHQVRVIAIGIGIGSVGQVLGISVSLSLAISIYTMAIPLGSQVLDGSVVVGSVEWSHSTVEVVDQLRVSLGLSLAEVAVMSKPQSQVLVSGGNVCIVHRSDGSTGVLDKLPKGGGGKTGQDLQRK